MRLPPFHVHPSVWLILGAIAVAYVVAMRRHVPTTP